jgi:hypothetical protein
MSYIRTLQAHLAATRASLAAKDDVLAEFRIHLDGPKFHGLGLDGGRKDWVAVADVLAWLGRIKDAGV